MSAYSFAEHIGKPILIGLRFPIVNKEGSQQDWMGAALLGSEPGGLWIKSEAIDAIFEQSLWDFEMEIGGPSAVGNTLEFGHFIPFSGIRFVKIVLPRSGDSQGR